MSVIPSTFLARSIMALVVLFAANACFADWTLEREQSHLNFISVKKTTVAETHQFKRFSGKIDSQGNTQIDIDLSSVDTAIGIRDTRLQTMLFETSLYPKATLSAKVDTSIVTGLNVGETTTTEMNFELSLHGATQALSGKVQVTALSGQQFLVTTLTPVIIKASDFNLGSGIDKLKAAAKLPSIDTAIPVTASWVFKKQ
ncbi:MAG: YceI family protein [Cellvibrionaceae bacterium]